MAAEPIRVLIIDDDEDDFVITRDTLTGIANVEYLIQWVSRYDEGLKEVMRPSHHVCLLDYRLGESNGIELLRHAVNLGTSVPIVLLTGQGDRAIDVQAMQEGAADYLVKGEITPPLLERTLRFAIERHHQKKVRDELIAELTEALGRVKILSGLLPICASCKSVRDDRGYWERVEDYIERHSEAKFSHGICPACLKSDYPEIYEQMSHELEG